MSSPRFLVIVGGSMAAIKAPAFLRRLCENGARVQVIATKSALEFVTELSLATAAQTPVATDKTWFTPRPDAQHLTLTDADATIVVGASADLISRAAHGQASDLASATLLSIKQPVLWAPAMNERMWQHPAVQANVATLKKWGHQFTGPVYGALGSQGEGEGLGRLVEPAELAATALDLLRPKIHDLLGVHVVVSAGPTHEYLDPVRFISNPSSGKMGFAVAQNAIERGANVTLISGPVALPDPVGAYVHRVTTALEMQAAIIHAAQDADIIVMSAAVSDYRVANQAHHKQTKQPQGLEIQLIPNPDILAELGAHKGKRILVGFAMETHAGVERAALKARHKNADFILLNYPTRENSAFGGEYNQVTLVQPDGFSQPWPQLSKCEVAARLLSEAKKRHGLNDPNQSA